MVTRKCNACGQDITFIRTTVGKRIPCNPGLVPYWKNPGGKDRIVTPYGETLSCDLDGPPEDITDVGYIPHWATCTDPNRFRRK